jgi:hypothetical protein
VLARVWQLSADAAANLLRENINALMNHIADR